MDLRFPLGFFEVLNCCCKGACVLVWISDGGQEREEDVVGVGSVWIMIVCGKDRGKLEIGTEPCEADLPPEVHNTLYCDVQGGGEKYLGSEGWRKPWRKSGENQRKPLLAEEKYESYIVGKVFKRRFR